MKIQTSFRVLPKYFNNFHNYLNSANEELFAYTYVPENLSKNIDKIHKI